MIVFLVVLLQKGVNPAGKSQTLLRSVEQVPNPFSVRIVNSEAGNASFAKFSEILGKNQVEHDIL